MDNKSRISDLEQTDIALTQAYFEAYTEYYKESPLLAMLCNIVQRGE